MMSGRPSYEHEYAYESVVVDVALVFLLTAIAAETFIKAFPLPNLFSGTG